MPEPESEEIAFRKQAESLLPQLPLLRDWIDLRAEAADHDRRAFVIEFAGMPKAGKSSAIENLRHYFSHGHKVKVTGDSTYSNDPTHRYKVHTPAEGVSLRTPSVLKKHLVDYNTWAGAYAVHELIQASHDAHNDLVILDRGPWDAGCWLEYWNTLHLHPPDISYVGNIVNFFQLPHWMTRSDLHVVLTVAPDEAANREQKSRLIRHGGVTSDAVLMQSIQQIYATRFSELQAVKAQHCPHVGAEGAMIIDTTGKPWHEVALAIIRQTFGVLAAKINHHLHDHPDYVHFTQDWLASQLDGYVRRTRGGKKLLGFLPEFVASTNRLAPLHRWRFKKLIGQASSPDALQIGARAPTAANTENPLQKSLEALREKARPE